MRRVNQMTSGKSSIPGRESSMCKSPVATGNMQGAAKSSEVWVEVQQEDVAETENAGLSSCSPTEDVVCEL